MKKSLVLRREALSELSTDELVGVVGAADQAPPTLPVKECLTLRTSCLATCLGAGA